MSKKYLGIICLLFNCAAFAANQSTYCQPGFYIGVQGGQSDTHYTTNDVFYGYQPRVQSSFTNGAYDTTLGEDNPYDPGYAYIITQPTFIANSVSSVLSDKTIDTTGFGGRIYGGYQFNPYFAAEIGYTHYAETTFNATSINNATQTLNATYYGTDDFPEYFIHLENTQALSSSTELMGNLTEYSVDLDAKGTLPLQYGFGVYAEGGMAYVCASRTLKAVNSQATITGHTSYQTYEIYNGNKIIYNSGTESNGTFTAPGNTYTVYAKTYQAIRSFTGIGVDYKIPDTQMDVSLFYNHLFGAGAIEDASLLGIGLAYKFV